MSEPSFELNRRRPDPAEEPTGGFVIEVATGTGKVCERYATYEEARRRVEQFPADSLVGIPFIFQVLADGSQRLVREDGKPLQWHRFTEDTTAGPDEPLPLGDEIPGLLDRLRHPRPE